MASALYCNSRFLDRRDKFPNYSPSTEWICQKNISRLLGVACCKPRPQLLFSRGRPEFRSTLCSREPPSHWLSTHARRAGQFRKMPENERFDEACVRRLSARPPCVSARTCILSGRRERQARAKNAKNVAGRSKLLRASRPSRVLRLCMGRCGSHVLFVSARCSLRGLRVEGRAGPARNACTRTIGRPRAIADRPTRSCPVHYSSARILCAPLELQSNLALS